MVKGNQTNITDPTLFTIQLKYIIPYNCICMQYVCVRACVRACVRVCGCACCVCTGVCVIVHVCVYSVRSCVCEAVLILYAILIRPGHI